MAKENVLHRFLMADRDGFDAKCFIVDDTLSREDYVEIDANSLVILKNKIKELNNTVILASVR